MIWILCKFHVPLIFALIETSDLTKSVTAKSVTAKGKCMALRVEFEFKFTTKSEWRKLRQKECCNIDKQRSIFRFLC